MPSIVELTPERMYYDGVPVLTTIDIENNDTLGRLLLWYLVEKWIIDIEEMFKVVKTWNYYVNFTNKIIIIEDLILTWILKDSETTLYTQETFRPILLKNIEILQK